MNNATKEFNKQLELDVMVTGLTKIDHEYVRQFDVNNLTDVIIPKGVISIEYGAFECRDSLTNVVIPESVIAIGKYAFAWCDHLTSITIPGSVTSIGDWAFHRCRSLASVSIGNSEATIGHGVFEGCHRLTRLTIEGKAVDKVKRQQLIGVFSQKIKCTDLVDFDIIVT